MNEAESIRGPWRSAMVAVVLNFVGMAVDIFVGRSIPRMPVWPNVASMAGAVVLAAILLRHRRTATAGLANGVFLLNVLLILAALWFTNAAYAGSGRPWVPFQANKLGMLTVALLAPELWVGLLSIGSFMAAALWQFATFSDGSRAGLAVGEPEATLVIGIFAAILLTYRNRRSGLEREVVRAQTQRVAMWTFARAVLAIRDLSNTPLQTITFASAAARLRYPEDGRLWDRIDRAAADIHALDARLREYERALNWGPGDESIDSSAELSSVVSTQPVRRRTPQP